ncbi:MAG: hypothetical protein K0U24_00975 [Gammaproteobacteria bacterium]|nr:hypothetical protein [Gammaproteobacteria bacterium]
MPQNKNSYFRIQRELIQIKQAFNSKAHLQYRAKPLDLLRPNITATASGIEGDTSASVNVSYPYSPSEMLLIAIWNQSEILRRHEEGASFSTEETSEFYANFNAFKAHPDAPEYKGVFAISDYYTYLIAVCWRRWFNSLSSKVLDDLNLVDFHQKLQKDISQYRLNQKKHALVLKDDVTQDELVAELEERFKEIYKSHKINMDKISDAQLARYITLRYLGYLVALSMFVVALILTLPSFAIIPLLIFSPVVGLIAHISTHVPNSISEHLVEENDLKYNESKTAIANEFPDWKPKTTAELIETCEKPEERTLMPYLQ